MLGAVHAAIGAAVGSLFRSKRAAFAAGVVSHVVADALPHKDLDPRLEVPLMAGAMLGIAKWRGADSPEFWGAAGGIAPDAEHGLMIARLIRPEQEIFPTHIDGGKYHGPESSERLSQLLIAGAALALVALKASRKP